MKTPIGLLLDQERKRTVASIVAWMRKRAEEQEGDDYFSVAWREGVRDMAAEIEANEDEKCGHAKEE